jgi:hypothetical protein
VDAVVDGFANPLFDAAVGACSANGTETVAFSLSDVRPFPFKYSNSLSGIDTGSSRSDGGDMPSASSPDVAGV